MVQERMRHNCIAGNSVDTCVRTSGGVQAGPGDFVGGEEVGTQVAPQRCLRYEAGHL